jgi:hypothetical protein
MGRIVLDNSGAARRPAHRARALWLVVVCTVAYVVGYVIVSRVRRGH